MVLSSLFRLNLNPPMSTLRVTLATQSSKAKRKWKEGRNVCLSVCLNTGKRVTGEFLQIAGKEPAGPGQEVASWWGQNLPM